jgi:RNA polymerase sigma-70 factor (ECF subfamily)
MDIHTANDLYQETVLHAFEGIALIDVSKNPKSYLFSIAVGKWKNMSRKANRRNFIAPEISLEAAAWAADGEKPESIAEKNERNRCIQKGLTAMKDRFRVPLLLFYFDHFSLEDIATLCKIPIGTVKSRLHKGRALLKKTLEKEGLGL